MSDIKGFFNARQEGDEHGKSIFSGIDGGTATEIIPDLPTFLAEAGRNYGILRTPALVTDPFGGVDEDGEVCSAVREVENQFHLSRTNDGRVVSPHTVTGQYAPLTLLDIAEEIQPWCDAGWVTPDAVYSGKNESLEILCLRMDASGMLPNGETWEHYIIFRNPHGSGGKAKGTIVSFRVQCANTFGAVGRGVEFVIGHRISATMNEAERQAAMTKRVQLAKAAWQTADDHIENLAARINSLSGANVSYGQAEALTDALLDISRGVDISDPKQVSRRKVKTRTAILEAFAMPQYGTTGATLYDWINGVTFVQSSPNAETVKRSKVNAIDRMIRNVLPTESGFKFEAKAHRIADRFLSDGIN